MLTHASEMQMRQYHAYNAVEQQNPERRIYEKARETRVVWDSAVLHACTLQFTALRSHTSMPCTLCHNAVALNALETSEQVALVG